MVIVDLDWTEEERSSEKEVNFSKVGTSRLQGEINETLPSETVI